MKTIRIFFLSLLILIVKTSFAQTYSISSDNILQYNKYINNAELLICDSMFSDALYYYEKAFKLLNEPFAIDKYNAAMCAFKTDDFDKGESYLEYIVKRGYDYKNLNSNKIINLLDSNYRSDLFHMLEQCSVEINNEIKNLYDSLYLVDQLFRKDSLYWITNRDTLCKTDFSNGSFMNVLIKRHGFPSQELVGVSYNLLAVLPWELIVIHNHVKPFCDKRVDFSNVIWDAMEQGLIRIPKAANYLEQSIGKEIFGTGVVGCVKVEYKGVDTCYYKTGFFNLSDKSFNKINFQRISIGLDSIEEARKKVLFNISNPDFIFSEGHMITYSCNNLTEFNNFIVNLSEMR